MTEPLVPTERLFGGFAFIHLAQRDGKVVWFGSCPQGRLRGGKGHHVLERKSDGIEIQRGVAGWEGAGCYRVLPRPAEAGSGAQCGGAAWPVPASPAWPAWEEMRGFGRGWFWREPL